MITITNSQIPDTVEHRASFRANTVRGEWVEAQTIGVGYLPSGEYTQRLHDDLQLGAVYIVFSYNTPIAWQNVNSEWTVPAVKYSQTTARHQTLVRSGIEQREAFLASRQF